MRIALALAVAGAMAACSAPEAPGPNGGADSPPTGADTCNAAANRSLIGQHVGAVSFPEDANIRVACTTCPVTQDYRPERMNVWFNEETGIIEEVSCG